MKVSVLLGVLVVVILTLAGCFPSSICGDGICTVEEKALAMCPQDCIIEKCSADSDCGETKLCGDTWKCMNGKCIETSVECPTCTDTDGGTNYYVKGFVTLNNLDANAEADSCAGGENIVEDVIEKYCAPTGRLGEQVYPCLGGCKDGACIDSQCKLIDFLKAQQIKLYSIEGKEYEIQIYDVTPNNTVRFSVNGMLTKQLYAGQSQRLGADFSIKAEQVAFDPGGNNLVVFCVLKEPSDYYIIKQNFGDIKYAESNSQLGDNCRVLGDYYGGCDVHEGFYSMFFEGSPREVNVLVDIYSEQFTFEELRKELWLQYVDDGGAVSLINNEAIKDGGDTKYYIFEIPHAPEVSTGEDVIVYWTSGKKIIALSVINYTDDIPFGEYVGSLAEAYYAKYPSDIQFEERISCSDTDNGRNYYIKGTVTISNDTTLYSDTCSASQLTEKYCFLRNGKPAVGSVVYTCPDGCSNGACTGTIILTCEDTDTANGITVKGKVYGVDATGAFYEVWDYCSGAGDKVAEMYCKAPTSGIGKIAEAEVKSCVSGCEDGVCL